MFNLIFKKCIFKSYQIPKFFQIIYIFNLNTLKRQSNTLLYYMIMEKFEAYVLFLTFGMFELCSLSTITEMLLKEIENCNTCKEILF